MKRNDIYMRDPFLFVEDGVGYLVGSTDEQCWAGEAGGFSGYRTTDLENFEGPFELFRRTDDFWANENFWAPEIHAYGGKYYMFASFWRKGRKRATQALVCDTPFGKYVPKARPFTPPEWDCLDGTFYEEDGVPYTVFCHEWTDCSDGEICLGRLNAEFDGLVGEAQLLFRASEAPWVRSHNGKDFITDAPFLFPLKSGKLLMLWSSCGEKGYALGTAVSENGIKGPWKQSAEPLFAEDGGHGMIFRWKGKHYLSLHAPNAPHMSERARFCEIEEKEDTIILKK